MTTWFTSDTHFSHKRIIELSGRPFETIDQMNKVMIEKWNRVVRPDDTVYHLGDVALGKIAESLPLVGRLNGRKILVLGNHDRPFMEREQAKHYETRGNVEKARRHYERGHDFLRLYAEVFNKVVPNDSLILSNGRTVNLSHFPYDGDSHDGDRFAESRLPDNGRVLIHGHTHRPEKVSRSSWGTLQIHVGVDAWDFKPVSDETVIGLIEANLAV